MTAGMTRRGALLGALFATSPPGLSYGGQQAFGPEVLEELAPMLGRPATYG